MGVSIGSIIGGMALHRSGHAGQESVSVGAPSGSGSTILVRLKPHIPQILELIQSLRTEPGIDNHTGKGDIGIIGTRGILFGRMADGLFFETEMERFHYRKWGKTGPLLHISHATGFNCSTYGPLAEILKDDFRVLAMDHRGHGRTSAEADPAGLRNWHTFSLDLERFFEFLGGHVIAAGHSMGAVASLLLAVKRPDLVKALILIDPTILPFSWMWWWYLAKKTGLARFVPIAFRAGRRRPVWPDKRTISEVYSRKASFQRWKEGFLEGYLEGGIVATDGGMVRLSCAPAWESRIFATCPHEVWRYIPIVSQPVMVIHGEMSDTFLPPAAARFRKSASHSSMLCIKGTGHFVPMERPQEVADAVRVFCGGLKFSHS